jgi:hypothetical protein
MTKRKCESPAQAAAMQEEGFKNLITSRAKFQSDDGADAHLTVICFIFCHFLRRGRRS